jgi:hypothetical protein
MVVRWILTAGSLAGSGGPVSAAWRGAHSAGLSRRKPPTLAVRRMRQERYPCQASSHGLPPSLAHRATRARSSDNARSDLAAPAAHSFRTSVACHDCAAAALPRRTLHFNISRSERVSPSHLGSVSYFRSLLAGVLTPVKLNGTSTCRSLRNADSVTNGHLVPKRDSINCVPTRTIEIDIDCISRVAGFSGQNRSLKRLAIRPENSRDNTRVPQKSRSK